MDAAPHFLYIVTSVGATRKNNMLMKQIEDYVAPAVEVIEVIEEKGSGGKPCVLRIDFL